MCHFLIVAMNPTTLRPGHVDGYGKWHLVRIGTALVADPGSELHGPRAAMGLHFLVVGHTGQRLSAHFEFIGLTREALEDQLHPDLPGIAQLPLNPINRSSQVAPRRGHGTPANAALAQQLGRTGLQRPRHFMRQYGPASGGVRLVV